MYAAKSSRAKEPRAFVASASEGSLGKEVYLSTGAVGIIERRKVLTHPIQRCVRRNVRVKPRQHPKLVRGCASLKQTTPDAPIAQAPQGEIFVLANRHCQRFRASGSALCPLPRSEQSGADQSKPDQIIANQSKPRQTGANNIRSEQTRANQIRPE